MSGKNLAEIPINSRKTSRQSNAAEFRLLLSSGDFCYSYDWNWAKMPKDLQGYEVCGTACDADGNLYITSRAPGHPVAKFSPDGNLMRYFGTGLEIGRAHGIFVDKENTIWFTDDLTHVIYRLSQEDTLLKTLGRFKQPSDTGIADLAHSHRLRFWTIKRLGGPFNRPTRIVTDSRGYLYATDGYGNAALHKFTPEGELLWTKGGMGPEPGHFGIPHSIWIDKMDRVMVADREFDRVQIFSTDGELLRVLDGFLFPYDVVSDDDYIYVSEREGRITILDMDYRPISQIGYYAAPCHGHSIAADKNGNLYLGQLYGNHNLVRLERMRK